MLRLSFQRFFGLPRMRRKDQTKRDAPALQVGGLDVELAARTCKNQTIAHRTRQDEPDGYHKLIGFYNRDEKCLLRGTN
jgi:hypothetical protein